MSTTPGRESRKGRGSLGPSNFSCSMSLQPARYAAVTAARSPMIPRMRVETILAARNRAGWIVILGCARPGDYGRVGIGPYSRPGRGSWRRRGSGGWHWGASNLGCRLRSLRPAMTGARPTARRIGGRSIGAKCGDLRARRASRHCGGRLHLALHDSLLVRCDFPVHAAMAGACTPSRRDGCRSVFTSCCRGLCLQRSCVDGCHCGNRSRENPMS